MRQLVIALASVGALLVAGAAHAQPMRPPHPAPPAASQPAPPPAAQPAPLPRTVAPPIVFPLPPLMLPPAGGLPPLVPDSPAFHTTHRQHGGLSGSGFVPFGIGFGYGYGYAPGPDAPSASAPKPPPAPARGFLQLSVTPAVAQIFVDSYYVGTAADINAPRGLTLEAGPHRIEIRAPQYQTVTVDVRILPGETVTYRAALEPAPPPVPVPRPAPTAPTTMYVIPKCYMGNVPPRPSRLPSGCDIKQVQQLTSPVPIR